jgi:hypothetical protein
MNQSAQLRVAARKATEVLGRFPLHMCLPLLATGLCGWILTQGSSRFINDDNPNAVTLQSLALLLLQLVLGTLTVWSTVLVSAMYLRVTEGGEPGLRQVNEVAGYRGFIAVFFEMMIRIVGWSLLFAIVFIGVSAIEFGIGPATTSHGNSIDPTASGFYGARSITGVLIGVICFIWLVSRYLFVMPMLAVRHGSRPNLVSECVALTRKVQGAVILLVMVELVPGGILLGVEHLTASNAAIPQISRTAISLMSNLISNCIATWFLLVATSLLVQVTNESPAIEPGTYLTLNGPPLHPEDS